MNRVDTLIDTAKIYGIQVDTWCPGTGKRKVRFIRTRTGTELGLVNTIGVAEDWLQAYRHGYVGGVYEYTDEIRRARQRLTA